ncbi:MAG: polyhydroxyalkanoate synthesis repressor PhaR [Micavibrio sp.]|jgi:polyhydroxyalkanoate synthesis repressor PhaR|nr:MAG: polyhydroxyalkanoate synthesis repressor PhaR [Micavibrio sp.]
MSKQAGKKAGRTNEKAARDTQEDVRVIKKYPNRRLYDTATSRYITLSQVREIIRQGGPFKVVDTNTDEDITRHILVQIITEQENSEDTVFTTDMLVKMIRFYDGSTRNMFSDFMDRNLQIFSEQHKAWQDQMGQIMGAHPMSVFTNMTRKNLDFWREMQDNFFSSELTGKPAKDSDDSAER